MYVATNGMDSWSVKQDDSCKTILPVHLATMHTARVVFDGGCVPNPGRGYGSYTIELDGVLVDTVRLDFSDQGSFTCNRAEWATLLAALTRLQELIGAGSDYDIEVRGDSQIVINGCTGTWKVRKPQLQALAKEVWKKQYSFAKIRFTWWGR